MFTKNLILLTMMNPLVDSQKNMPTKLAIIFGRAAMMWSYTLYTKANYELTGEVEELEQSLSDANDEIASLKKQIHELQNLELAWIQK